MTHPISSTYVGNHKLDIPAKPISQCNQPSPTSVSIRNIGHSHTIIKNRKYSSFGFCLLHLQVITKMNIQNAATLDTNSLTSPLSYEIYLTIAKTFRASLLPCEQAFAIILVVKQPINHEYAPLYFAISQKTTAKTNDTRIIQYNQCLSINTIHQRYTSQYGAPMYPFLQIDIVRISAPSVPSWYCL